MITATKLAPHIVVISHDVIGPKMAGPGIRYWNLARVLSRHTDVTLAIPDTSPGECTLPELRIHRYRLGDWNSLAANVQSADGIVMPTDMASEFPQLAQTDAALVIDGYDPLLAEWLFLSSTLDVQTQNARWFARTCNLGHQYLMGDFFICASERQRDWWLGQLEAYGRINPYTFGADSTLRRLVDVVAYGMRETPPQHTRAVLKGVWPGIEPRDRVILWGGGLWPWLDPLTAIRAMAQVAPRRPDAKLVFPGTKHPNPMLDGLQTHNQQAMDLARSLGLLDKSVFFGDWIPYEDWPNVLLESDLALTLHTDTLEARLAFRSRLLDYIWAGLPTVATQGDATSDLIARYDLGSVVGYADVDGVAEAILAWLAISPAPSTAGASLAARFARARSELTWEQAAHPLIAFCCNPRRAPDRAAGMVGAPFYLREGARLTEELTATRQRLQQVSAECDAWRDLAQRYERGRLMRLLKTVHDWGERLKGRQP